MRPQRWQPTRLPRPWDSPGKNTGVYSHSLLQGIFPTQGPNWSLLSHWPAGSLLLAPPSEWSISVMSYSVTPGTVAYQAPPSMEFSRQEYWTGLPFPSPMHESEKWKWITQSCPTHRDPMDCSLPGSSIHWIFQARVLDWVAIPFSLIGLLTHKII